MEYKKKRDWKEIEIVSIVLAIVSAFFVYVFSTSTSPVVEKFFKDDSAIFQVVGRAWARGKLPYVDIFDHKGPLLFAINAVGYKMGIGSSGILLLQWLFCVLTFGFIYKTARLHFKVGISIGITLLSYLVLAVTYSQGNLSEEYSLLFIVVPLYLSMRYFKKINLEKEKNIEHPPIYAFWYGLSFMAIVLMRMTNAIVICCIVFVVLCVLLCKKSWKNLAYNVMAFMIGAVICFLPFAVYFWIKGALGEMCYATFLYNFLYASGSNIFTVDGDGWNKIAFAVMTEILLFVCSIFHVWTTEKKKDILGIFSLLLSVTTAVLLFRMNRYVHYYMITMPYFVIAVIMLDDLKKNIDKKRIAKLGLVLCSGLVLMQVLCAGYKTVVHKKSIETYQKQTSDYVACCDQFMGEIPKEEHEDVLVFGTFRLSQWYLVADINPCYKYAFLQDWWSLNSKELETEILNYLQGNPAKWMVVEADFDTGEVLIDYNQKFKNKILEQYTIVDNYKTSSDYRCYQLYKRKD